jgi:hypothetical protein
MVLPDDQYCPVPTPDLESEQGASEKDRSHSQVETVSLSLPLDRMPEAEVALRLAFYLFSLPGCKPSITVAIDGEQVKSGGKEVFPLSRFLQVHGWQLKVKKGKNPWQGHYVREKHQLCIVAKSGIGDVVAVVGRRKVRAECKKGPLKKKEKNDPGKEYPLLHEAIGQLMTVDEVGDDDYLVVAVPYTTRFEALTIRWQTCPLMVKTSIHFALVGRNGQVKGLQFPTDKLEK